MKKDRMEYLLFELVDMVDILNKCDNNKIPYKSTYDILSNEIDDSEMKELGLDIKYLKGE